MTINFFNETEKNIDEYIKLINNVFDNVVNDKIFSIIFVDDEKIHQINKEYRNVDRVTDVISFALCDDDELEEEFSCELGDIFIDIEQAIRQANEYGHSIEREIAFLAVHGYLHLCGYDHMTKEDEDIMLKKQDEILLAAKIERK